MRSRKSIVFGPQTSPKAPECFDPQIRQIERICEPCHQELGPEGDCECCGRIYLDEPVEPKFDAVNEAIKELLRATEKFGAFNSPHEGYAVILEELDELWEEIKSKDGFESGRLQKEAVQVAAMALRFLYDCCGYDLDIPEINRHD